MTRAAGDKLLKKLLGHGTLEEKSGPANDLLDEVFRGYPVEEIRALLRSTDPDVVRIGAWLVSELGELAKPLLGEMSDLLRSKTPFVRFYSLDCILTCAGATNGSVLGVAVKLIDDDHHGVRRKAIDFLVRAERAQLQAALDWFESQAEFEGEYVTGLRQIVRGNGRGEIERLLRSDSPVLGRLGLVAVLRQSGEEDVTIRLAMSAKDPEVREIIRERVSGIRSDANDRGDRAASKVIRGGRGEPER